MRQPRGLTPPRRRRRQGRRPALTPHVCQSLESRLLLATYYIDDAGSDTVGLGTAAVPWASFSRAYGAMDAGDTLIVKDGTYARQRVMDRAIRPPSGTPAAYTVVRAENAGGVVIDGQGSYDPINMEAWPNSPMRYVQFDGLVFRHQGGGATIYDVQFIKFTRCGFEDAADGNAQTFRIDHCSDILVEDCFAWGSGRYKFMTQASERVIFRRCVARFDRVDAGGEPIAAFAF